MAHAPAPWEVDGLPYGLADEHFALAVEVWISRAAMEIGSDRLRSVMGVWGTYGHCTASLNDENQVRTQRLIERSPMHTTVKGPIFPAIFMPDPTPTDDSVRPLAIISAEGYVGSSWSALATALAPTVVRGFRPDTDGGRNLFVTSLRVAPDHSVDVWLPKLAND